MPIIDNAVYVDGVRIADPPSLDMTFEQVRAQDGMAWIGLLRPTAEELATVAAEFDLHALAVEDARKGHQRAKLERYGETLFVVLRPAWYIDATETVEFGELHVFVGRDFVVTVRHGDAPNLARVRQRMEAEPGLLALGPEAVLYAILDEVVDQYAPVVSGVENDIDEIEDALFTDTDTSLSRRIYELSREVIAFQRGTQPLGGMLEGLLRGGEKYGVVGELSQLLRDVHDHVLRLNDRIAAFRAILDNALTVHATIVTQRQTETSLQQNEQVKKISGWAAILFGPTLVGGIYGMNFEHMPELEWAWGYPMALALMAVTSATLWGVFKWRRWM
ncbi:magnesium and cobalt transport protein CorA [Microbacterium oryzae]|uniref:magnesium and cobalt transport protein CorA n=1 Tax=Microbacterium oryzae TaxID=743009 RepID=UPI0025B0FD2F|nr:magnesium and cobalt transport protein CorA [Microbacterium oryzae]MDN3310241.1 magnesium and cobalt transport protein CorA [Microbacterium oryzae]